MPGGIVAYFLGAAGMDEGRGVRIPDDRTGEPDGQWKGHLLMMIGLQGKKVDAGQFPPMNLVFLMDPSGSMSSPNKLPLLKRWIGLETVRFLAEQSFVEKPHAQGNFPLLHNPIWSLL